MATQRAGKGSPEERENGVIDAKIAEGSAIRERQSRKQKVLKEQQQWQSTRMRWILLVLLLAVAAVSLFYYLSYYNQTIFSNRTRHPARVVSPRQKTDKQKQKQTHKKSHESETKSKPKDRNRTPNHQARKNDEIQRLTKESDRVLRQPIPVDDPDRPHMMDIMTADNLVVGRKYQEALERFNAILSLFPQSPRALFGKGITLYHMAEEKRSNKLKDSAIDFFRKAGLESPISSETIRVAALTAMADRAWERGKQQLAIRGMEKLVELRSEDMMYANKLGMFYLIQGNTRKAKSHFKKAVVKFEGNHFGQAQLGYLLYREKHYEQALPLLMEGIRQDADVRNNGHFYNYAGDTLTRLNRSEEALVLYGEGVSLQLFPSVWQRSTVNEPGLRAQPWWTVDVTGYMTDIIRVEKNMKIITSEALAIFDADGMVFIGGGNNVNTPHYVLFSKGKKNLKNCQKTPKTCALVETFPEAAGCRRGTVKFSSIPPQTHIASHVGGTNTKLQVVVGLQVDVQGGIKIRVAEETKIIGSHQIGVIDESFEKEIWYIGEEPAVYLSIDVWHPDLSDEKRRHLGPL